jgi:Zn2+/Cd2+-exporting ATPase
MKHKNRNNRRHAFTLHKKESLSKLAKERALADDTKTVVDISPPSNAYHTHDNNERLSSSDNDVLRTRIRILQMDCDAEVNIVRKVIEEIPSVTNLEFNLILRELTVTHLPFFLDDILVGIKSLGFEPELNYSRNQHIIVEDKRIQSWQLLASGILILTTETLSLFNFPGWLCATSSVMAILLCGVKTYKKGMLSLRKNNININLLITISVTGALILGQWSEAAFVIFLFSILELIEVQSLDRARNTIESQIKTIPTTATLLQPVGTLHNTHISEVSVGSTLIVKAGEQIVLDGIVTRGSTVVDQSPITGVKQPIVKKEGDWVFAGTINGTGCFEYLVTAQEHDTVMSRIVSTVENAQSEKSSIQKFMECFSSTFMLITFAMSFIVAILPPLFFSGSWHDWIYKSLVVLVIGCPCSLISTIPVTMVYGLIAAARKGIIINSSFFLAEGRNLKWIIFDYLGTKIDGATVLSDMIVALGTTKEECGLIASSLASYSNHPMSKAITAACGNRDKLQVEYFEAINGIGIRGVINGELYSLGNVKLLEKPLIFPSYLKVALTRLERKGKAILLLCGKGKVLAIIAVVDTVNESSREAVSHLHFLKVNTVMFTDSNSYKANALAEQLRIDEIRYKQRPSDKQRIIEEFSKKGKIAMVFHEASDSPSLARSNVSFAIGLMESGVAIDKHGISIMDDDFRKIPYYIRISRQIHLISLQNIALALILKIFLLLFALYGLSSIGMALFVEVVASLLAFANGFKILRINT